MEDHSQLQIEIERLLLHEKEVEKLLSVTTHNLREPLRHVLAYTQLLHSEHLGEVHGDAADYLRQIEKGARRMEAILNGLSTLSNLNTRELQLQPTGLKRIVDGARLHLSKQIQASGAQVRAGSLPAVLTDEGIATEAVQHLLDNAIKFCRDSVPEIEISATSDGETVTVAIRDNGIGVGEPYREKCFGLFKRLHSQSDYPGEGVGLAYARKAIERLGGTIWMEGNEGQGTTLKFTLPAAKE